jgi:hypothetical protein
MEQHNVLGAVQELYRRAERGSSSFEEIALTELQETLIAQYDRHVQNTMDALTELQEAQKRLRAFPRPTGDARAKWVEERDSCLHRARVFMDAIEEADALLERYKLRW